jgi:type IV secretory pathway VirB2 component (pilin)
LPPLWVGLTDAHPETQEEIIMLIVLAVILGIAWLMGFTVFHVASGAIHLLVILAIASLIFHFVRGRGTRSI